MRFSPDDRKGFPTAIQKLEVKHKLWSGPIESAEQAERVISNAANGLLTFCVLGGLGAILLSPPDYGSAAATAIIIIFALTLKIRRSVIAAWVLLVFAVIGLLYFPLMLIFIIAEGNWEGLIGTLVIGVIQFLIFLAVKRAHTAAIKLRKNDFSDADKHQLQSASPEGSLPGGVL